MWTQPQWLMVSLWIQGARALHWHLRRDLIAALPSSSSQVQRSELLFVLAQWHMPMLMAQSRSHRANRANMSLSALGTNDLASRGGLRLRKCRKRRQCRRHVARIDPRVCVRICPHRTQWSRPQMCNRRWQLRTQVGQRAAVDRAGVLRQPEVVLPANNCQVVRSLGVFRRTGPSSRR